MTKRKLGRALLAWTAEGGGPMLRCVAISNNFPRRQFLHQSQVGFEEIEPQQFLPRHPPDFAKNPIFNLALIVAHFEESQFHRPATRIFMEDAGDLRTDPRPDPQRLLEVPAHRIARLFAFFDLASGEFPWERHRLVPRPLA